MVIFFYSHYLGTTDYGHYQAFWVQLNVFNAFLGLGLSIFTLTYSPAKLRFLFSRIPKVYFFYFLIFLSLAGLGFGFFQEGNHLSVTWTCLFLLGFVLCQLADSFLIAFRKLKSLVFINLGYAICFFFIHYSFINPNFDFNSLLKALLPLLLLKLLVSVWVLFKLPNRGAEQAKETMPTFSNKEQRAMLLLWGHLYFYDVLQMASFWIDKFIVSLFMSAQETGLYFNATLNIPFIPIFLSAIVSASLLQLSEDNSRANLLKVVNDMGRILSSIAFPICVFLLFFRKEFVLFAFSEKYLEAIPIFLCATLILPFRAYGHTVILQNLEQGKIINQGAILDVVLALAFMYPLYLWMGLPGLALSFVLSTFLQCWFYYHHTRRLTGCNLKELYPWADWLKKALFFTVVTAFVFYLLPLSWSNTLRLFVGLGLIGGLAFYNLKKEWR